MRKGGGKGGQLPLLLQLVPRLQGTPCLQDSASLANKGATLFYTKRNKGKFTVCRGKLEGERELASSSRSGVVRHAASRPAGRQRKGGG